MVLHFPFVTHPRLARLLFANISVLCAIRERKILFFQAIFTSTSHTPPMPGWLKRADGSVSSPITIAGTPLCSTAARRGRADWAAGEAGVGPRKARCCRSHPPPCFHILPWQKLSLGCQEGEGRRKARLLWASAVQAQARTSGRRTGGRRGGGC